MALPVAHGDGAAHGIEAGFVVQWQLARSQPVSGCVSASVQASQRAPCCSASWAAAARATPTLPPGVATVRAPSSRAISAWPAGARPRCAPE
jgi:hypothetical protein